MPKTLTFHIIFHSKVFKDNLDGFTPQEISDWISWVAVNEKIPKVIPDWIPPSQLTYEYTLPKHNPMYQMLHFYQNSFFFHLLHNPELLTSRYIGFGQYDMKFNAEEFRSCVKELENDTADKAIGFFPYPANIIIDDPGTKEFYIDCFIKPYQKFFHITHTLEDLSKWPLFLIHTFILPTWFFKQMMEFLDWNLPTIFRCMNWESKHLAGTIERLIALFISAGIQEGRFRVVKLCKGTDHNIQQHSGDSMRNIPTGSLFKQNQK